MASEMLARAARRALGDAMAEDARVVIIGEDVATGGPFTLTTGLAEQFGTSRVRNAPISEGAFMGAAVGLALAGGRPFVDIMFDDFVTAASDQLFNHAAKIHYMSGGRVACPVTVWTLGGADKRWGAQHSQNFAGLFAQIPGLKVLSPISPAMAYSSVRAALADPDPVVLLVDRSLLYRRDELKGDEGSPWEPRIVREGTDVSVICAGRSVYFALKAANQTDASLEIIDLQRLAPLDVRLAVESIGRTSRAVVAYDETGPGLSTQVTSAIAEQSFHLLDAPIVRVTSANTPIPTSGVLEDAQQLSVQDILRAVDAVMRY